MKQSYTHATGGAKRNIRIAELALYVLSAATVFSALSGCGSSANVEASSNASATNSDSAAIASASKLPDGSQDRPLRVMLVPADGGTESGTRSDFEPVFNAVTKNYGLHFEIRVGQSYNTVVEAMSNQLVDIAFFGAVSYQLARDRNAAQLLAVEERDRTSIYYSGIFCLATAGSTPSLTLRVRVLPLATSTQRRVSTIPSPCW